MLLQGLTVFQSKGIRILTLPTNMIICFNERIINNVNFLIKYAELDATIDETTFATASLGESDAGVTF